MPWMSDAYSDGTNRATCAYCNRGMTRVIGRSRCLGKQQTSHTVEGCSSTEHYQGRALLPLQGCLVHE